MNPVERFTCTLRQRGSRLMWAPLSVSKKLAKHGGAITYFICDYNLTDLCSIPRIALPDPQPGAAAAAINQCCASPLHDITVRAALDTLLLPHYLLAFFIDT
jgi:hypothetical protein